MDKRSALIAFAALSQETRLDAFRLLVAAGEDGVAAGTLSETLECPHNTLSFHLSQLYNADLVHARRKGRSVIYSANFPFVQDLIRYMVENCCSVAFASVKHDSKRGSEVIEFNSGGSRRAAGGGKG